MIVMLKQNAQTEKYGKLHKAFPSETVKTNFLAKMEVRIW
jgi:hypothetical protein